MATMPTTDSVSARIHDILVLWTIPTAERAAAPMKLSAQGRAFWMDRYTKKFTVAMCDGRTWEYDGHQVLKAAERLGKVAARIAKKHGHREILEEDAREASEKNDCPALALRVSRGARVLTPAQLMAAWCK